jgi:hypothetical protein
VQYLEYAVLSFALLIFLAVVAFVGIGLLVKAFAGSKAKARATPVIYPIPPAERGTGAHVSLLDLVDDHVAHEDRRRRRQKVSDRLYDWTQDPKPEPGA